MIIEDIIENNKGLIYKISNMFYGVEQEDLFQAGVLGLLKAYKNYKEDSNAKFSSYAYEYIYGEMYNLSHNKTMKINKDILKLYQLIEKTRYELAQKYERVPDNHEISSFLGIDERIINEAIISGNHIMSLDSDEGLSVYDKVSIEDKTSLDDKILLDDSIENLPLDEKNIIKARYYEDLTQSETAKKLAMSQVMVSRYEKKGISRMRAYMYK